MNGFQSNTGKSKSRDCIYKCNVILRRQVRHPEKSLFLKQKKRMTDYVSDDNDNDDWYNRNSHAMCFPHSVPVMRKYKVAL